MKTMNMATVLGKIKKQSKARPQLLDVSFSFLQLSVIGRPGSDTETGPGVLKKSTQVRT
jgi:hypothetical protein